MTNPGASVTMDEIGEQIAAADAAAAGTDPNAVKLDGDKIPEALRGKTVAEVLRQQEVLEQSLKIANEARKAAEANAGRVIETRVETPVPVTDTRYTKEQLAELFETDPIAAVAYMNEIATKNAEAAFERRFAPLVAGTASNAEATAKKDFSTEFELFGDEIKQITAALPDKSILSHAAGWENIISYVRGKPGNFEKLVERGAIKKADAAAASAREAQDRSAGAVLPSGGMPPARGAAVVEESDFGLDRDERHAADVMNMPYKEYAHWKRIGG